MFSKLTLLVRHLAAKPLRERAVHVTEHVVKKGSFLSNYWSGSRAGEVRGEAHGASSPGPARGGVVGGASPDHEAGAADAGAGGVGPPRRTGPRRPC
jgi:hypothetical protein